MENFRGHLLKQWRFSLTAQCCAILTYFIELYRKPHVAMIERTTSAKNWPFHISRTNLIKIWMLSHCKSCDMCFIGFQGEFWEWKYSFTSFIKFCVKSIKLSRQTIFNPINTFLHLLYVKEVYSVVRNPVPSVVWVLRVSLCVKFEAFNIFRVQFLQASCRLKIFSKLRFYN